MVFNISNNNIDTTKKNEKGSVWKQYLISFMASLPFFTHGIETTILSSSAHSGHFTSSFDNVPWSTTAFILGSIFSAPIYCYIADTYGRKVGIYLINLLQGASCIPLLLQENEVNDIALHALAGITSGGLFTVLPSYVREISDGKIRGLTLSIMSFMTSAGHLMNLGIDDESLKFFIVGTVMVQFLMMFCLLESPTYFVKVGKLDKATGNVLKLKCLTEEHQEVLTEVNNLKDESYRAKSLGNISLWTILKNQIWRDAFKIGLVLHTVTMLGGNIVFLDQQKALAQLDTEVHPPNYLVPLCLFGGSVFTVALIRVLERKYLLTIGYTVMVISMGVLGVYTQADLTVRSPKEIPIVSLAILIFGYGVVWCLPVIVMVEILNLEIRAKVLGILYAYSQIIKLAHVHSFQHIEEYTGRYSAFYIFACINIFGAVYSLFNVPYVQGKSIKKIERQLKRVPLIKL